MGHEVVFTTPGRWGELALQLTHWDVLIYFMQEYSGCILKTNVCRIAIVKHRHTKDWFVWRFPIVFQILPF